MRPMQSGHPLTSVYIVDDSESIRQRLVSMLSDIREVTIVGEAKTGADAIEGIVRTKPNSVLLDLNLGATSGLGVLKAIRERLPVTTFVVLTNHSEPQYRTACIKAGARYFLDKSTEFDRVCEVTGEIAAKNH